MNNEIPDDICGNLFAKSYVNYGFDVDKPRRKNVLNSSDDAGGRATIVLHAKDLYESSTLTRDNIETAADNNNCLNYPKQFNVSANYYNCNKAIDTSHLKSPVENCNEINYSSHVCSENASCTSITWNNLTFRVKKKFWQLENSLPVRKSLEKQILQPQNGHIGTGSLTALMGPSGAGKTTLLNCITGRYMTGVAGQVTIKCPGPKPKATIAFVPQKDTLYMAFTVRETLIFASKMKNLGKNVNHENEACNVAKCLSLTSCYNERLAQCSGGEVKRVSIAVELISHPDILVIDEPTSGLDSSTAIQCVKLLRRLVESKNPIAVVTTIHQPNYKVLQEFTSLYVLSRNGQNIFFGPPSSVIDHFADYNLQCPTICNPADFAIEVASGEHGEEVLDEMARDNGMVKYTSECPGVEFALSKAIDKLQKRKKPFFKHTGLLMKRGYQNVFRSSFQMYTKNLATILIALNISYLFEYKVGEPDGCWDSIFGQMANVSEFKRTFFKVNLTETKRILLSETSRVGENSSVISSSLTFVALYSMIPCCLFFPTEFATIRKEIMNNWYKASSFFAAKVICDIPPMLFTSSLLLAISYPLTGQIAIFWRFSLVFLIIILTSQLCQSLGTLFGMLLCNDIKSAALVSIATFVPAHIFCGAYVRYSKMLWIYTPINYINYLRLAFDATHLAHYGFGRCGVQYTGEDFTEEMSRSKGVKELLQVTWKSFNMSLNDMGHFSSLLKVNQGCFTEVFNETSNYLGLKYFNPSPTTPSPFGFSEETVEEKYVPIRNRHPSYILTFHELTESMFYPSIAGLIIYTVAVTLILYFVLKSKTKLSL